MSMRTGRPRLSISFPILALVMAFQLPGDASAQGGELVTTSLTSDLVPGEISVSVLLPPEYLAAADPYPLLLFLHGASGSSEDLVRNQFHFRRAWTQGNFPPVVVATPSVNGDSRYLDFRDGNERWETFILTELLPRLREEYRVRTDAAGTVMVGISMGGLGSLRLAFKYPEAFGATAALAPELDPAFSFDELDPSAQLRSDSVIAALYGDPVDRDFWAANNPATIVRDGPGRLRESGIQIYLEVGDEDHLELFKGAEFLHRILFDSDVRHEYRLVRGAGHVDASYRNRLENTLSFIARVLRGGF